MQEFLDRQRARAAEVAEAAKQTAATSDLLAELAQEILTKALENIENQASTGALERTVSQAMAAATTRAASNAPLDLSKVMAVALQTLLKDQARRISSFVTARAAKGQIEAAKMRGERETIERVCAELAVEPVS